MPRTLAAQSVLRSIPPKSCAIHYGAIVSQRLVLIVPSFPKLSETFIVSKFLGLLEKGWDVHIVCGESKAEEWRNFPALNGHAEARSRVRISWPHRPQWLALLLLPIV